MAAFQDPIVNGSIMVGGANKTLGSAIAPGANGNTLQVVAGVWVSAAGSSSSSKPYQQEYLSYTFFGGL